MEASKALRSASPSFAVDASLVSNILAEACVGAQNCVQRAMEGGEALDQATQVFMTLVRLRSEEVGFSPQLLLGAASATIPLLLGVSPTTATGFPSSHLLLGFSFYRRIMDQLLSAC